MIVAFVKSGRKNIDLNWIEIRFVLLFERLTLNNLRLLFLLTVSCLMTKTIVAQHRPFGIVIHGGAGYITSENVSEEAAAKYEAKLIEARDAGYAILEQKGTAEEAVVAAIRILEDSPLFNAGKGSVLTHDETAEMDASIMRGNDLNAGAVAGVMRVKNPITAARAVMNHSDHVMLSGTGADAFAESQGLDLEDNSYFILQRRLDRLRQVKESEKQELDHHDGDDGEKGSLLRDWEDEKYGTVGAVALDQHGNLAAATSTGGMTNKRYDRIGDSPIIGAGTYANNRTCAVSCTGHGEYFIRLAVAHEVSALMQHRKWDLEKSASYVIHNEVERLEGEGGLIAIDRRGNVSMPFNTPGMFRAFRLSNGAESVAMFGE